MRAVIVLIKLLFYELIRRKDIYFILALLLGIIIYSATITFGGESGFSRYFREVGITMAYLFSVIVAAVFAGREIPEEMESRSAYVILAHLPNRSLYILGKYLGVFFIALASFSLFYGVFVISDILRNDHTPILLLAQGFILHIYALSFYTSLAILMSLFLSVAANVTVMMSIYFAMSWFGVTLPGYIFLPHPELFDMKQKIIHTWDIIPWHIVGALGLYALIYTSVFLALSHLVFRRRNI